MKLFDPIIMTGIGFFYFLFGLVFSAEEVIFSSRGAPDFNRWFSFGKDIEYHVDGSGALTKDCVGLFTGDEKGSIFSPVIDIHPQSDVVISIEFNIQSCKDLKTENLEDIFSMCSPLLKLYYIELNDNEDIFIDTSEAISAFDLIRSDGLVDEDIESRFHLIDSLSDKYDDFAIFTTRNITVPALSKKIQFKVDDDGSCFALKKFDITRYFCPSFTFELQYFHRTYAELKSTEATGKCVQNSSSKTGTKLSSILCDQRGNWAKQYQDLSSCQCNPGFEPNDILSECQTCRKGYFKNNLGNDNCKICPINSASFYPGAEKCLCVRGYQRPEGEDPESMCSKVLTLPVQNIKVLAFDTFVKVQWNEATPVDNQGHTEGVIHEVSCWLTSQANSILSTVRVYKSSSAIVTGLISGERHECSVSSTNPVTREPPKEYTDPFITEHAILPNSGRAKQVGADRLWHINWNAPDKLVELRQNATTFGDGITQYDVIGYVIEATEAGRGANVQQTQRAIVQNTTNDLNALFPVFKNQFANVSFKIRVIHQIDSVQINSTDTFNIPKQTADADNGGGTDRKGGGGSGGGLWEGLPAVMGVPSAVIALIASLLLLVILILLFCTFCICIHCRKSRKSKYLNEGGQNGFIPPPGSGGPFRSNHESIYLSQQGGCGIGGMGTALGLHPHGGYHQLNNNPNLTLSTILSPHTAPGGYLMQMGTLAGAGSYDNDIENNYDDLDTFQRETGAPTNFIQNNILKSQLSCKEQIGKGNFSTVHRARYTYQERQGGPLGSIVVAVKEPSAAYASELQREIEIMAHIQHPNIVTLIGIVQPMVSGEAQQIVMEYMEYGSLEQFLHSHRHLTQTAHYQVEGGGGGGFEGGVGLGPVSLLCMLGDVADAMNYLHLNNYVHRDLAARNVLVGRQRASTPSPTRPKEALPVTCKLSDFGLCRSVDNSEGLVYDFLNSANRLLPVRWIAPEVLEYKLATFAGDVWSFSIVTWEVFSYGQRPYWKWDSANIMSAVEDGYRLPVPPACPLSVYEEIMSPCWRSDPTQRPLFADILPRIQEFLENSEEMLTNNYLKPSNFNPFHQEAKELVINSENSVERWLKLLKMEQHWSKFRDRGLLQLTQLTGLSYIQLKKDLEIQLVGNRRKIIQSIEVIRELQNASANSSHAADNSKVQPPKCHPSNPNSPHQHQNNLAIGNNNHHSQNHHNQQHSRQPPSGIDENFLPPSDNRRSVIMGEQQLQSQAKGGHQWGFSQQPLNSFGDGGVTTNGNHEYSLNSSPSSERHSDSQPPPNCNNNNSINSSKQQQAKRIANGSGKNTETEI